MNRDRKGEEEELKTGRQSGQASSFDADAMDPSLPPEVQERIGDELRKHYAQLIAQPLPDRFIELLTELAESEEERGQS